MSKPVILQKKGNAQVEIVIHPTLLLDSLASMKLTLVIECRKRGPAQTESDWRVETVPAVLPFPWPPHLECAWEKKAWTIALVPLNPGGCREEKSGRLEKR